MEQYEVTVCGKLRSGSSVQRLYIYSCAEAWTPLRREFYKSEVEASAETRTPGRVWEHVLMLFIYIKVPGLGILRFSLSFASLSSSYQFEWHR